MSRRYLPSAPLARWLIVVGALAAIAGGCVQLEERERELTFRPSRVAAGWFSGIPDDVREIYLPVGVETEAPKINAW